MKRNFLVMGFHCALFFGLLTASAPAYADGNAPNVETLASADKAMAAQDYGKAREILVQALNEHPGDAYLTYNVALTYYAEKDYAKAQDLLEQADLTAENDELRSLILAQLGNIETHEGRAILSGNAERAIDHFRRAHQIYQASLTKDSGQKIARSNQVPVREGLVTLLVGKAEAQIVGAQADRQISDRIQKLMATRGDLEEALQLDPDNKKARSLHESSEEILVGNLQKLGDRSFDESQKDYEAALSETDEKKKRSHLNKALTAVREAENAFQDGLILREQSQALKEKLDEAVRFSSTILLKLGEEALASAAKENVEQKQIQGLESAIGLFDESLQADSENAEAQKLKSETQKQLAEMLKKQGDEAVAKAEQVDKTKVEALNRERADAAYSDAAALNPDDAELQEKLTDNALKLAEALEETGNAKLEEGKAQVEASSEKAVATLEDALGDLTKAAQLLEEHGEPSEQAKGAMDEASGLLAEAGTEEPGAGESKEPGEETPPGDEGASEPGEAALAENGEGEGAQPGSEPGSEPGSQPGAEPGSQPGSQPGGPSMKERLTQSSEAALAALQEARAQATTEPVESPGDVGGKGTPSYETVAYVTQGSDFNNEEGGGSTEREGNFNTQSMNQPARDW